MYARYGHPNDDYIAAMSREPSRVTEDGKFVDETHVMSFHHGEMPAFASKEFATLEKARQYARDELGIVRWRDFQGQFTNEPNS